MLFSATVLKRDTEYEETGVLYVGTEAQPVEIWTAGGSSGNYDHRQCRELAPGDEVTFLGAVPRPVRRGVHCIACISDRSSSETPTPSVSRIQNECRWTAL